jgi:hypothetical protein
VTIDKFIGLLTLFAIYVDILLIRLRLGSHGFEKPTWWAACSTAGLFVMGYTAIRVLTAAENQRDMVSATLCLMFAFCVFAHASLSVIEAMRSSP